MTRLATLKRRRASLGLLDKETLATVCTACGVLHMAHLHTAHTMRIAILDNWELDHRIPPMITEAIGKAIA